MNLKTILYTAILVLVYLIILSFLFYFFILFNLAKNIIQGKRNIGQIVQDYKNIQDIVNRTKKESDQAGKLICSSRNLIKKFFTDVKVLQVVILNVHYS